MWFEWMVVWLFSDRRSRRGRCPLAHFHGDAEVQARMDARHFDGLGLIRGVEEKHERQGGIGRALVSDNASVLPGKADCGWCKRLGVDGDAHFTDALDPGGNLHSALLQFVGRERAGGPEDQNIVMHVLLLGAKGLSEKQAYQQKNPAGATERV